ncbi:MAG: Integral membrane protein [Firmicutes bacterium]|nr:Integral membrane protein [Bacillota bacterium]MDI6705432.1 ZIP family metal transporter [Bacillota bacterium]
MREAALWGGIAGSAVYIGALAGLYFKVKKGLIGFIMAYGTGVLIGAATFELLALSLRAGGIELTVLSFVLGAMLFTLFDLVIARKGGKERKRSKERSGGSSGLAIFIGTVLDAVPESFIIGASLVGGHNVSWLLITAVFISNFPEGLSSSVGLRKGGYSKAKVQLLWLSVLGLSIISSMAGYVILNNKPESLAAVMSSFAAGAVVSMASSTMMPEAYEEGGPVVGFLAALGLISSLLLTKLE